MTEVERSGDTCARVRWDPSHSDWVACEPPDGGRTLILAHRNVLRPDISTDSVYRKGLRKRHCSFNSRDDRP